METVDAIGLDLDGTLWNSNETVVLGWQRACRKRGGVRIPSVEDLKSIMGMTNRQIARTLFPEIPEEEGEQLVLDACDEELLDVRRQGGKLFPGVKETILSLSEKVPFFIVSNCNPGYIEAFLDYYDLRGRMTDWECHGANGLAKAGNIRLVSDRNGFRNVVYVGDTAQDMSSAREARVSFIHAAYGFGIIPEDVPAIQAFSELAGLAD